MRSITTRLGVSLLLFVLAGVPLLSAGIYPQAGFEFYLGTNHLRIMKPWVALRFSLSNQFLPDPEILPPPPQLCLFRL